MCLYISEYIRFFLIKISGYMTSIIMQYLPPDQGNILDERTQTRLISPAQVAEILGRSKRWVYQHWRELGGTRAFGPLSFFPEVIDERLAKARQEAKSVVLQVQMGRSATQTGRLRQSAGGPGGRGRTAAKSQDFEDRHGVLSDR
jgi:hypothetical protein